MDKIDQFLFHLNELQFERAEELIGGFESTELKKELYTLNDLLYWSGQKDSTEYQIQLHVSDNETSLLQLVNRLNRGYYELFYRKVKGEAFKYFRQALRQASEIGHTSLQKAALYGILEYYRYEIAQNSRDQYEYLAEFNLLADQPVDQARSVIYGLIYYSKSLEGEPDENYFSLASRLDEVADQLETEHRLLPSIYHEKALALQIGKKYIQAKEFYLRALDLAGDWPFNHQVRFDTYIQLSRIANNQGEHRKALAHLKEARKHSNQADTLRANHFLNKFSSFYYRDLGLYDSAYTSLNKAYMAEYFLDFRRNSREINRLNVVLETQQKELENFRLRQNAIWLVVGLGVVLVLLVVSYLAYKNIRSKKKIVENEKELETQKVAKLLKEQELIGVDAMIEGQEKERRRIANDLHDNLGGLLAALKHRFQTIRQAANTSENGNLDTFGATDDLLEEAYQQVRTIAHARNAGVHAQKGLLPAVKNFVSKVSVPNKLEISVMDHDMDERLDNSLEITLFRIIQELITNIIKHAEATEACVHLTHHEDSINVMVEDNGKGMNESQIEFEKSMGLSSIKTRVENLNGNCTIESVTGAGTSIILDIPIS